MLTLQMINNLYKKFTLMKKKKISIGLLTLIGLATISLSSCSTDNNYDFDEIDTTIGIGGDELVIPTSSTDIIKLSDVLELEENGSVVEDAVSHDYVFRQTGADVAAAHPMIDKIVISKQSSTSNSITLNFNSASGVKGKRAASTTISAEGNVEAFEYVGNKPDDVVSLSSVDVESKVNINVVFPTGLSSIISTFDNITVALPEFMTIEGVSSNCSFTQTGSKLSFNNVSASNNLSIEANITKLDFNATDTSLGNIQITSDGKIKLNGNVHLAVSTSNINFAGVSSIPENVEITSSMTLGEFTVNGATGKFSPSIELSNLGEVNITGIPDFLTGGNVVVDLYNPQITLSLTSDTEVAGLIDGTITSVKDGQTLATIYVNDIPVNPNATTNVLICRRGESIGIYDKIIVNDNLSDLIKTIPDKITFTATASADATKECYFELGKQYTIKPAYSVDAPIAFAENANIEYKDTLDGFNDDIEDFELAEGAYLSLTANITSCVPAYLSVDATPIDINGNALSSSDLAVEVTGEIAASADGVTETVSPIEIKITQNSEDALDKLDGILLTVSGKASSGNGSVTGITLNAERHTLVAKDITIKIVGKVIGNF